MERMDRCLSQKEPMEQKERKEQEQEEMHFPWQSRRWLQLPADVRDLDLEDRNLVKQFGQLRRHVRV